MIARGDAGGVVGTVGGNGDSIALWIALAILGVVALSAYPAQRKLRLIWGSRNGAQRKGKGSEMCIKFSDWDSSPS